MNKKEFFEKELDERLAAIKAEMLQKFEETQEEQEDVFPKYGDKYYYLTVRGNIESAIWTDGEFDRCLLAIGNLFKTEEEAKFERERRKVIAELKKYAEDREWDVNNDHYFITWDYAIDNIAYHIHSTLKHADIYFESEERAMEAVEAVGEDRVRRFYLEVED